MSLIIGIGTRIGRRVNKALNKWHTVVSQLRAMFLYRVAGGADNDDLPESNGRAVINTIYGNTVKWNQQLDKPQGGTVSGPSSYNGTIINNVNTTRIEDHVYYLSVFVDRSVTSTNIITIGFGGGASANNGGLRVYVRSTDANNKKFSNVAKANSSGGTTQLIAYNNGNSGGGLVEGDYITLTNPMMIDLTALEYPDIATNTPTVAEVEAWLALNVGTQDYYPHDEGSLIGFKGTGIKSVGFNLFDKNDVLIGYWKENGDYTSAGSYRRTRDYIPVFPETNYYIKDAFTNSTASLPSLIWYDSNKQLISSITNGSSQQRLTNKIIQSPEGAAYVKFSMAVDNLDIVSFNLSNPDKNGTYEPYREEITPIDPIKIYGTPGGSSILEQVYPDGMFGALDEAFGGDALGYYYGSLCAWVAVRKIDLGNCLWSLVSGCDHTFETSIDIDWADAIDYSYSETIDETDTTQDKLIGPVDNDFKLGILDRSLSSSDLVDGHIAALEGVYALITPYNGAVDYYNLVYRDNGVDTPLEQLFPFKYKVDKYSTEEVLVPTGDAPTSTSMIADIEYQAR